MFQLDQLVLIGPSLAYGAAAQTFTTCFSWTSWSSLVHPTQFWDALPVIGSEVSVGPAGPHWSISTIPKGTTTRPILFQLDQLVLIGPSLSIRTERW